MVITAAALVRYIIALIVFALVVSVLFWIINVLPIASPYKEWIVLALKVLCGLFVIGLLLQFAGIPVLQIQ